MVFHEVAIQTWKIRKTTPTTCTPCLKRILTQIKASGEYATCILLYQGHILFCSLLLNLFSKTHRFAEHWLEEIFRDHLDQTPVQSVVSYDRLLRTISSRVLDYFESGDATAILDTLTAKFVLVFFFFFNAISSVTACVHFFSLGCLYFAHQEFIYKISLTLQLESARSHFCQISLMSDAPNP